MDTRTKQHKTPVSGMLFIGSLITAVHFAALYASRPIFPLLATEMGASEAMIGLLTAVFYALPLIVAIPAGLLVDRFGPRNLAVGGGLCLVLGNALYAVSADFQTLAAARVLCGLAQITVLVAAQSFVAQLGRGGQQDRNFGTMFFFAGAGQFCGPLLGGLLASTRGMRSAFWISSVIALVPLALACYLPGRAQWIASVEENGAKARVRPARTREVRWPNSLHRVAAEVGGLLRMPGVRLGVSASAILLLAEGARESFYPLYAKSIGMGEITIGLLLSIHALFSILIQPFAGLLAGALGRPRVLATAMFLGFVGHATVPLTTTFWPMAGGVALAGLALGTNQPPSMACVADATPPDLRGLAMSIRLAGNRAALLSSPVLAGYMVTFWGLGAYFYASAGMLACGSALMLALSRRQAYSGRGWRTGTAGRAV